LIVQTVIQNDKVIKEIFLTRIKATKYKRKQNDR